MKFSIRDLLLVTMIVAILAAWWVDRTRLASRVKEAESYQRLSEVLAEELRSKYPAAKIEISIDGRKASASVKEEYTQETTAITPDPAGGATTPQPPEN